MRFSVLGPLRVSDGSGSVELKPAKPTALLCALLLRPDQAAGQDYLQAAIWDASSPDKVKAALQTYVMRLRKLFRDFGLADEVITTTPAGYRLPVDAASLDLIDFRTRAARAATEPDEARRLAGLRDALGVWTVAPVTAAPLANVASDMLHRDHVPALVEEWKQATEQRFDLELRLGGAQRCLPDLRELCVAHPTHERFSAQLAEALYEAGRQREALAEIRRLRELLRDDLGVDPGEPVRRLELSILRGETLHDADETGRTSGAVRMLPVAETDETDPSDAAGTIVLPREAPCFVGRARELTGLAERLRPDRGGALVVITGPPGIGKSALAVRLAHQLAPLFSGGVGYVPVPSRDAAPAPRTTSPRLLLVEDPAHHEDVLPYLPDGAGSVTVVTSRQSLLRLAARHGAAIVRLQPLGADEARDLLTVLLGAAVVEADPRASDELARLCGYFPAALVIAASRLRLSRDRELAAFVAWLATDPVRKLSTSNDETLSLRRLVSRHVDALNLDIARAFIRMAQGAPDRLDSSDSGAVLGLDEFDAELVLERLVEASLLEVDSGGRYSMHPLLRAVGTSLVDTAPIDTAMPVPAIAARTA